MIVLDKNKETPKRLNQLAREQMKVKILNDILLDMTICKIEGWDVTEYIKEIKQLVSDIKENK